VPSYHVYICDRCSRRLEGGFISAGWCQIDVIHGFADDEPVPTEAPEAESYILCDRCSPTAVAGIRESTRETQATTTH